MPLSKELIGYLLFFLLVTNVGLQTAE